MSMEIAREGGRGRSRRILAGFLALLIAVVGLVLAPRLLQRAPDRTGLRSGAAAIRPATAVEAGKAGDLAVTEEAMKLAEIEIGRSSERLVYEKLAVSGSIEPSGDRVAKITPRVGGKVIAVHAVAGDVVRAGQVLLQIESAELARAQADLRRADLQVSAARVNLARQRQLAALGAFGQPRVHDARRASITAGSDAQTAESEVSAARAEIAEAESELRSLKAALSQAQTQVRVAQSRLNRAELLLKEQLIARQEWEQAQADVERAQADVEAARAQISQADAKRDTAVARLRTAQARQEAARRRQEIESQALRREEAVFQQRIATTKEIVEAEAALRQAQLDRTAAAQAVQLLGGTPGRGSVVAVAAPIAGRVHERSVSLGEMVDTEHPLFTIVNLDTVWAQLAVAPRDLPRIRAGQRVQLTAETAPGRVFVGTISSVAATADEAIRAVRVRIAVRNAGGVLRPGAFVRGTVVTDARRKAVVVPEGAIQDHSGRKTVYVARGRTGEFEVRHVKLGVRGEGWREVASGLLPDTPIAVRGTFYLKSEALKSALSDGCCAVPGE